MSFNSCAVLFILCAVYSVSSVILMNQSFLRNVGSSCVLPESDGKGVCTLLKRCPEAKCLRKVGQPVLRCGMKPPHEVVCCAQERKSEQVCRAYRNHFDKELLIYKGEKAEAREFPHMVLIMYRRADRCGGTLISPDFILTAAHCFLGKPNPRKIQVYLGDSYIPSRNGRVNNDKVKMKNPNVVIYNVSEVILHPNFMNKPKIENDIALLRLSRTVDYSDSIIPACLYHGPIPERTNLTATGWGSIGEINKLYSDDLRKVNLEELELNKCNDTVMKNRIFRGSIENGVTSTMICAIGEGDTCPGDSGGPLSFKPVEATRVHNIVGITSIGPNPCGGTAPSIYTRVSKFLDWIECIVWPFILT